MECFCPKCSASLRTEKEISESGDFETCLECKTKIWIQKESFMLRAYKKEGDIFCVSCSNILGISSICKRCGELFPDYYIVQLTKKKIRKNRNASRSISFRPRKVRRSKQQPKEEIIVSEKIQKHDAYNSSNSKKILLQIVGGFFIISIFFSGWFLYQQHKTRKIYMENFIMALYGMKAGVDMGLNACEQEKKEVIYTISKKDSLTSKKIRLEIDPYLDKLQSPPSEFMESLNHLNKLNSDYNGIYLYSLESSGTLLNYCDGAKKLENAFNKTAGQLKTTMPEDFAEAFAAASLKYKKLKFMVN
ncbi:MAG: hypothetical protein WDA20_10550 [Desulfuromonadales bacterium]